MNGLQDRRSTERQGPLSKDSKGMSNVGDMFGAPQHLHETHVKERNYSNSYWGSR